jgi:hypothetical protein
MSETMSETTGKVVWFELPADDTSRARGSTPRCSAGSSRPSRARTTTS